MIILCKHNLLNFSLNHVNCEQLITCTDIKKMVLNKCGFAFVSSLDHCNINIKFVLCRNPIYIILSQRQQFRKEGKCCES